MATTPPLELEYKTLDVACADAAANAVWGSEHPEEDGVRNLIVAVTGVRDDVGDIIMPGAFEETLAQIEPKGCIGHDWNRVMGFPEAIEELLPGDPRLPKTDRHGRPWSTKAGALCVRNRYHLNTEDGQRAYKDAQFLGARLACSIGYVDPKDENTGKPLHSYKAIDPDTGLLTRYLPKLKLFEYSQVLHGAHTLAGGIKSGQPDKLERKNRPDMELKVRLVRDSAYWGLPLGTPIRPGMKPQGPKAQRIAATGQQADVNAGAVEVDANNLRVKPTAKGKLKGEAAVDTAYSETMGLMAEVGYANPSLDSDDPIDPFDSRTFVTVDETGINKGEAFNPLDILIANAIPPAEVEENLRNADWDNSRLGDSAERQGEIDSYIADVVDAYREKYNARLVEQNDQGDSEVAEPQGDEARDGQEPASTEDQPAVGQPDDDQLVEVPVNEGGDGTPPPADEPVAGSQAAPSLEDGRTMQAVQPQNGEAQAFELTGENGATLRVYSLNRPADPKRPWTFDVITADGEKVEGESTFRSPGSALVRAEGEFHEVERGDTTAAAEQDRLVSADGATAPTAAPVTAPTRVNELLPGSTFINPDDGATVTVEFVRPGRSPGMTSVQGTDSNGTTYDAVLGSRMTVNATPPPEQDDEDVSGNLPEAPPAAVDTSSDAMSASPRPPAQQSQPDLPETDLGIHDGKAVEILSDDGTTARLYDPLTLQTYEAPSSELLTGGASDTEPVVVKLNETQDAAADVAFNWDTDPQYTGAQLGRDRQLRITNVAKAVRAVDEQLDIMEENPERKRNHGRALKAVRAKILKMAKPGEQADAEALTGNGDAVGSPSTEVIPEQPSGESTVEPGLAPEQPAIGEPGGETDPALAAPEPTDTLTADELADAGIEPGAMPDDPAAAGPVPADPALADPAAELEPPGDTLTADDIADSQEAIDAGYGITEAPDGEFEADDDIADRQDRVAGLLAQADQGSLDLTTSSDDQLRGTRADIVDEIRLQQHLERRRNGERAAARQQAQEQEATEPGVVADDEPAPVEDPGPKPRPGVAGAAEDLADALDDGDQERVDTATDRFRKALNRSRSDSAVVEELRAMLDPAAPLDAEALRDAAQRLRDEQRAKRNEGARRRRTARRFERERLRSLLGQVETEMRNRDLDYDPIPDEDGAVTISTAPPVAWTSSTQREDWSGVDVRVDKLNGASYSAKIVSFPGRESRYDWAVISDDGNTLASGSGTASDPDSARATIEITLDTQRRLGLVPVDAQVPQSSVSQNSSATPLNDVADAIGQMQARIDGGRRLNPVTGKPDPFGDALTPLPAPERSRFADAAAVRKYLEIHGVTTRGGGAGEGHNVADTYRWDTAKLTPGGAFAVIDDLQGRPQIVHTVTGATFPPPLIGGKSGLNRPDLLRYATISESLRDVDGNPVDWNQGARELMVSLKGRKFTSGDDADGGRGDLRAAVLDRLTREKIAAGQFTHVLVRRDSINFVDGVTNPSRKTYVTEQERALGPLLNNSGTRGRPNTFDKKTLDAAAGARTLAALGAPDAASALLTRRAAEVREQYEGDAPSHGSAVLESLASGYLGMFSPVRSHGERVRALKAGERVFVTERSDDGEPPLRSFRALAAPRRDPRGGPSDTLTPVIDEKTGEQKFLHVAVNNFRIEDTEQRTYGYNPLGGDFSHGDYVVVGPGEEPPATLADVRARQFDDANVIPQDVLDAAAEALPESTGETAARRATPTEGVRPPRRRSPAAPKRTAQPPAAPEPIAGEQHLAQAQGRTEGEFLGMSFSYGGQPERGSFDSVAAVREHLLTFTTDEGWKNNYKQAGSANAVIREIDDGEMKLSPGGVFLVRKNGYITHASTGLRVWPPSMDSDSSITGELTSAGGKFGQAAGLRVAQALESGVFDGEQLDWSGDGKAAVLKSNEISKRNNSFHPMKTAQRAAYQEVVLGTGKPTKTDQAVFRDMASQLDLTAPNPEAFDQTALISTRSEYSNSGGYAADSKKNATLVDRVNVELRMVEPLAKTAPLDAVRRLTRLADELDGQTITMRIESSFRQRMDVNNLKVDATKTLTPSDDLRKAAKMITDVYDPDKISESARFRQADMIGQVEIPKPKITMGRSWEDPNGVAGRRLEKAIKDGGGIYFYRDENGLLHATFTVSETGRTVDIVDGQVQVGGGTTGAIKLAPDGRMTLSYVDANRLTVIEGAPGSWKFTPEGSGNEDNDGDISGPEIESPQAGDALEEDTGGDIETDAPAADETEPTVEDRIRKIYWNRVTGPQEWVPLRWIRPLLGDVDRAEVDKVLLEMIKTGMVHLVASSNRKTLLPEDHAAALKIGDEDKHMMAIEEDDGFDYDAPIPGMGEPPRVGARAVVEPE